MHITAIRKKSEIGVKIAQLVIDGLLFHRVVLTISTNDCFSNKKFPPALSTMPIWLSNNSGKKSIYDVSLLQHV